MSKRTAADLKKSCPRGRPGTVELPVADPWLPAKQAALELGISQPTFYRAVAAGTLPAPTYVVPGAPRWRRSKLHAAAEATAKRPNEAMAERVAARSAKDRTAAVAAELIRAGT